ncbi:MAG TPA: CHAT domain-containing protein, partial [Isosphaeraceae bacterium]
AIVSVFRAYPDRVAIVHYGGHAGPDQLLLEAASGGTRPAHAEGLAEILGRQAGLKLVFLNGCSTRAQVHGLLQANVPAVIATARDIEDETARSFAESFYAELASGANLRRAFEAAKGESLTARGTDPRAFLGERRGLAPEHRDLVPSVRTDVADARGFPWDLYERREADQALRWNLFEADPLHGLPPLPADLLPPVEPFRRLERFTRASALVFFGRGRAVRELYDLIVTPGTYPVVLYHGPTGVGKSSILEAGLLPRLERDVQVLALRRDAELGLLGTLRAGLSRDTDGDVSDLAAAWRAWEDRDPARPRLVVVLDQAEEAFTRPRVAPPEGSGAAEALRRSWIDPEREVRELVEALRDLFGPATRRPAGKLILGFRMEWLQPFEHALREATLGYEPMALGPLDRSGIVEAIEEPARAPHLRGRYGLTIADEEGQPRLGELIADDLQADAGSAVAPTLQVLLGKMWDEARKSHPNGPRFDRPLYDRLRREGVLLDDFLVQQVQALHATHPDAVDSGFYLDLLEYHATALGTAETRSRDDLRVRYPHRVDALEPVLNRLKELYLLIEAPEAAGSTRLAHDTLAPLVRERYRQSLSPALRGRRILEKRAVEWHDGKEGAVLDRADLMIVEQALTGMRALTDDERRLLDASRAAERQRQADLEQRLREQERLNQSLRRRLYALVATVAATLGVAAFAGVQWRVAHKQTDIANAKSKLADVKTQIAKAEAKRADYEAAKARQRARVADAQRLAAQSAAARLGTPPSPQLSLLLAVEAALATMNYGEPVVPSSEQALHDAFEIIQGRFLGRHEKGINALVFAPDGRLVTSDVTGMVRVWDLANLQSEPLTLSGHPGLLLALAFAPDGRLVCGGSDGTAVVWDLANLQAKPLILRGHGEFIHALAFAPDGRLVTGSGSGDGTARVWDLTRPQAEPLVLRGHHRIFNLAFAPDGRLLTGGGDGTARVWDLAKPQAEPLVLRGGQGPVGEYIGTGVPLAIALDGRLVTGNGDGTARVWDLAEPQAEPLVLRGHEGSVDVLAFAPDGRLLTGGEDGMVRVWDLANPQAEPLVLCGHQGSVLALAFAPDARLVAGGKEGTARVWDLAKPQAEPLVLRGHQGSVLALAFAPDGRLVTGGADGTARVWDLTRPQAESLVFRGHQGSIHHLAFAPDGRLGTGGTDGTARTWDLTRPQAEQLVFRGHRVDVYALAFAPDGRLVTGDIVGMVRVWDLAKPQVEPLLLVHRGRGPGYALAFAPDGRLVTGGIDGTARVWDLSNPQAEPLVLRGGQGPVGALQGRIVTLTITPDGRLVTGGIGTVQVWDLANPQAEPLVLRGHQGPVLSLAFAPDGRLVTVGDGTARTWDLTRPQAEPLVLRGHQGGVSVLAFASDGRLVTGGRDGTVRVWELDPKRLIELAAPVVGRNLSWDEWERFFGTNIRDYHRTFPNLPDGEGVEQQRKTSNVGPAPSGSSPSSSRPTDSVGRE